MRSRARMVAALVALALVGCSCTGDVREGLYDLQRDFGAFRRASVARVASNDDARQRLGDAIDAHLDRAIERTAE